MQKKNKKGFTIVELVVVIAVIGILSAILIPTFMGLSDRAREQALQSDLSSIYTQYAVEAADGVVDETGDEIAILNQHEVAIEYKEKIYFFNSENVWKEDSSKVVKNAVAPATKTPYVVVDKVALSTFSGGLVYNIK